MFAALLLGAAGPLAAQVSDVAPPNPPPRIDSVAVIPENVFTEAEADRQAIFRILNGLHFTTQPAVVEKELLFRPGQLYDSARVAETERNLRSLGIFRRVHIDSVRADGKLVAVVHTRDAWSTRASFRISAGAGGTVTGKIGLTESNLFGTGNLAHVAYRKDTDRNALETQAEFRRIAGSQIDVGGTYFGLSDGDVGGWWIGDPWRSNADRWTVQLAGDASDNRVLQYRVVSEARRDTTLYRRNGYGQRILLGYAPRAWEERYVRFGVSVAVRNDRYAPWTSEGLSAPPPADSVKATVGFFTELRKARFVVATNLNGFGQEDVDLSPVVHVGLELAPSVFGYRQAGIGPRVALQTGGIEGAVIFRASLLANALFTGAGVDSGRVALGVAGAAREGTRNVTFLNVQSALQENPPPGGEIDLGYEIGPRAFEPHSFVGTRAIWGTLEHRWYAVDSILDLFGLGFAAFVDYGGAWYRGQPARWGGNVGIGLRLGSVRAAAARAGRIDLSWRFGDGAGGMALSLGTGARLF